MSFFPDPLIMSIDPSAVNFNRMAIAVEQLLKLIDESVFTATIGESITIPIDKVFASRTHCMAVDDSVASLLHGISKSTDRPSFFIDTTCSTINERIRLESIFRSSTQTILHLISSGVWIIAWLLV